MDVLSEHDAQLYMSLVDQIKEDIQKALVLFEIVGRNAYPLEFFEEIEGFLARQELILNPLAPLGSDERASVEM